MARAAALGLALALAYGGLVVIVHGVSRDAAFARAGAPRLEVRPEHRARPFDAGFERSLWVRLEQVPPALVAATLLREDRRFREHAGVDPRGLARALWDQAMGAAVAGGGSTITQQVAKMLFVGRQRSLRRKIDEALAALWLETQLSKDEILEIYLNTAYFGAGVRGVEAAARRHFGVSLLRSRAEAARLDAVMAAQLALALPQPARFDPADTRDAARIVALLAALRAAGVDVGRAPRDVEGVRRAIRDRRRPPQAPVVPVGADHRDRSVAQVARLARSARATYEAAPFLRADHQLYLEREVGRLRADGRLARDYPFALAYVVDLRSGGVTAQVGHAERVYPGSLTKPLILLCAFLGGDGPDDWVVDEPYGDPPQIRNRGRGYLGRTTLQQALAHSVNSVFARILDERGEPCVRAAADAAGAPMWLASDGATGRLGRRTMALGAAPVETAGLLDFYLALGSCGRLAAHSHVAALWRPGSWRGGWRAPAAGPGPAPQVRTALAQVQAAMAAAARDGTAHRLGALFRGPVAAKTGTDDEGRQFGIVAFTGRWLVYLSFWTDRPRRDGLTRSGGSLAPAVAQLLVNLHIDTPREPLSCAAPAPARRMAALPIGARDAARPN